jgi:hypothetical protein
MKFIILLSILIIYTITNIFESERRKTFNEYERLIDNYYDSHQHKYEESAGSMNIIFQFFTFLNIGDSIKVNEKMILDGNAQEKQNNYFFEENTFEKKSLVDLLLNEEEMFVSFKGLFSSMFGK